METLSVINIDNDGMASKITSYQKRLVIESEDGNMTPHTVTFMHKVSKVLPKVHVPIVHIEDASKFDYHIVQMKKADDDLFINVEPMPGIEATYNVYILFTNGDNHVSKKDYTAMTQSTPPNYIAHFPSTVMGSHTGVWQIGIETVLKNTNWRDVDVTDVQSSNGSYLDFPTFKLATVSAGCMTWNEALKSWGTKDCQGTWIKATSELQCKCKASKEMTFANSFYVAPNKIDYKTVFLKFSPLSQAAVIGVLFVIFTSYFIILAWATHRDKTDILKWGITTLNDNFADDNYFYVIKVFTGMRPNSGTRSRVSIIIGGEEMDTGVRQLDDGVRKEFPTGSVLQFLMCTPRYLGDLVYIRVWHDNSGLRRHASWYLSKVEIEDIQRNEKFTFLAGKWLAIDESDERLDCVIPVSKDENMNKFKFRVIHNAKENIAESHAWLSVVYRPQTSNFTRKQRASCALMFIMLSLIANAMFFKGSNEDNYELPTDFEVGPLRISLHQVYQSLISGLVVTPATLLVIYLFKLSRYYPANKNKPLFDKRRKTSRDFRIPFFDAWLDKEKKRNIELERKIIQKGYPEMKVEICNNYYRDKGVHLAKSVHIPGMVSSCLSDSCLGILCSLVQYGMG
ncbi:polycystin-1-like protein 2 [Ruditapes philippinarum]|uniref:polycystin-1-like protein 2 n=1 Tax=Ruditapes philippinarum TaxID=129788 RepID=UPI00295A6EC8|nr:polycystin-1-like protein 2 [Ruditapes philippinarum]